MPMWGLREVGRSLRLPLWSAEILLFREAAQGYGGGRMEVPG